MLSVSLCVSVQAVKHYTCWPTVYDADPALGKRLVFAGSVERPHCVLNIAGCEDIKTVSPLIESKDDLVTVYHLPGSKS